MLALVDGFRDNGALEVQRINNKISITQEFADIWDSSKQITKDRRARGVHFLKKTSEQKVTRRQQQKEADVAEHEAVVESLTEERLKLQEQVGIQKAAIKELEVYRAISTKLHEQGVLDSKGKLSSKFTGKATKGSYILQEEACDAEMQQASAESKDVAENKGLHQFLNPPYGQDPVNNNVGTKISEKYLVGTPQPSEKNSNQ